MGFLPFDSLRLSRFAMMASPRLLMKPADDTRTVRYKSAGNRDGIYAKPALAQLSGQRQL